MGGTSENNFTALSHFCLLYGRIKKRKKNNDTKFKCFLNISDRCTHAKLTEFLDFIEKTGQIKRV